MLDKLSRWAGLSFTNSQEPHCQEFRPPVSKEDLAAVEGKVVSVKFTAVKSASSAGGRPAKT
jgi:hypothetical protein